MRLKVIDIKSESDSESDYETAVDISHWSMHRDTVLFESPGGVRFSVDSKWEQTTYSYMEPDFDHMEKTGETVWLTHPASSLDAKELLKQALQEEDDDSFNPFADESVAAEAKAAVQARKEAPVEPAAEPEDDTTQYSFDGLFIASPAKRISVAEFQDVFRGTDGHPQPWDVYHEEERSPELNARVAAHLGGTDGRPTDADPQPTHESLVNPSYTKAEIERDEIKRLSQLDVKKGYSYEIDLSPAFEASILAAEKLHIQVSNENAAIVSENVAHAARARIGNVIDEMVSTAQVEMKRSFSPARP